MGWPLLGDLVTYYCFCKPPSLSYEVIVSSFEVVTLLSVCSLQSFSNPIFLILFSYL